MSDNPPNAPRTSKGNVVRTLDAIADDIRDLERCNFFDIGKRLLEAKEVCDHGLWEEWLHENFNWSQDTAENYMKAARLADKFRTVRNLNVPASVVYKLAGNLDAADLPAIIAALIEELKGKKYLTVDDTEELIEIMRPKPKPKKKPAPASPPKTAATAEQPKPEQDNVVPPNPHESEEPLSDDDELDDAELQADIAAGLRDADGWPIGELLALDDAEEERWAAAENPIVKDATRKQQKTAEYRKAADTYYLVGRTLTACREIIDPDTPHDFDRADLEKLMNACKAVAYYCRVTIAMKQKADEALINTIAEGADIEMDGSNGNGSDPEKSADKLRKVFGQLDTDKLLH
jgi:hypothetical protein